ncbi:hypothetical protein [Methylocystis sp. SC2]|uniref:hypothetical protein n=1 Tax=Methylocystis sp. (strain SC2) TaxID=187303 RepID=UPI00027AECD8|nr:hypothetical protein [Methylocystis sp. SC2]CCJ08146.1 Hypothetical protein BN69_2695 [Methylocystis sp. SC2]
MDEKDLAPASHEGSDISGGFIAIGFASTILGIIFLALVAWALYPDAMIDRTMNLPLPSFPEPRLQIDPAEDWTDFHRRELTRLNSAGWIDQAKGAAHIPIAAAMRKIAQEGIADWPAPAPLTSPSPKENANEAASYAAGVAASQQPPGLCATDAGRHGRCIQAEARRAPAVRKRIHRRGRTRRSHW